MKQQLTNQESLNIIAEAIENSKFSFRREDGFYFLLWGYSVAAAALIHYAILHTYLWKFAPYAWLLLIITICAYFYKIFESSKAEVKRTFQETILGYVWISACVCIAMLLTFGAFLQHATYPVLLMIYGFALVTSGGIYSFRPLIFGGIFCWLCAMLSFYINFNHQLLLLSLALAAGYILPGHLIVIKRRAHASRT